MQSRITIGHQFWGTILEKVRTQMIPFQLRALKDEIPGAEPSHALENFKIAAGEKEGEFYGFVFQDSDVGKWIEAASYSLRLHKDEALEKEIDSIISLIGRAQQPDGYLNTYFTVKEPNMRWQNLRECHEMYSAGHLIEGAVSYYLATGKRQFLDIMIRMADHIYDKFGPGKCEGYPGHPELELALYRLADVTHQEKYKELANLLLDRRGTEPNYFREEMARLGDKEHFRDLKAFGLSYCQAHKPLREQERAVGHSVRAFYLYAGAADAAAATQDPSLIAALDRLWENVVSKQMYVTGGFGATCHGESFAEDYELPNDLVYAETCASIAFIFWAKRMLRLHRRGRIADEMERALYNTVLSGANLAYDRYFYVNPLEVLPGISGTRTEYRHVLPERPPWFGCACCPPNMARLLLSLYDYAYDFDGHTLGIHLFVDGSVAYDSISVSHSSQYPWDGALQWSIQTEKEITLALRIPGWGQQNELVVDGKVMSIEDTQKDGYCYVTLGAGQHTVSLTVKMQIRRNYAHAHVRADAGCVALQRGPIVYCLEEVDNGGALCALRLPRESIPEAIPCTGSALEGMMQLKTKGLRLQPGESLYDSMPPEAIPQDIVAVPYFAWGNRSLGEMRVWIHEA